MNSNRLFRASCVALITTAMSFALRGERHGRLDHPVSTFPTSKSVG